LLWTTFRRQRNVFSTFDNVGARTASQCTLRFRSVNIKFFFCNDFWLNKYIYIYIDSHDNFSASKKDRYMTRKWRQQYREVNKKINCTFNTMRPKRITGPTLGHGALRSLG
jgi:hypothetical protein